ncbi:outer membrane beta-barrel protein [Aquabacterium sp.]|uniref:outer membrane beta-barrel protein n=1 Tax=Aquabacterium sp. TaxID=1872578 RepID=UPI003D6CD8F6
MRTQALCTSLSFKRLSLAAAVVSGVLASSVAHAGPFSAYIGATAGLAPSAQSCDGYADCDRVAAGAKLFGGWNVTPNVAAEVNYFYFGKTDSGANLANKASRAVSAKAVSLGMNWTIELFEVATSNVRLGVARVKNTADITNAAGALSHQTDQTTSPYLGLGMSFPFNRNLRMVMGYDFIQVPGGQNRNLHMLSGGFQGEF